ncbi:MAG: hypothetical protein HWQ38_07855 [Nostoc sp. NMS7]|uniref:hypothetical protein n=1 Tax=Nostoc sp. NMS7 TaxID=2815391 RepID=UPI0025E6938A|nr:hypothetical protein [Nostoc sp. NMS7]MBN3946396.1 hypothetical protein [Nostoc sp. NMS7]
MTQYIGFRCPDDLAEILQERKTLTGKDTTTFIIEALNFWLKNKPIEKIKISDEHIQELIDSKTQYLANAMNEVKDNLEGEIESLKTRLAQQEIKLGEY